MDVLLRVVNEIKSATQIGEVCGVFYIDLKSAFDTVWRKGILYKLAQKGLQGKLFKMICAFLEDRSIRVIMGETQSDEKNTEAGTPQGAVLSPKLFNILEYQSGDLDLSMTTELTLKSRKLMVTTPPNKPTEDHHTNLPFNTPQMLLPSKLNLISLVPMNTACSMENTRELSHQDSLLTLMTSS